LLLTVGPKENAEGRRGGFLLPMLRDVKIFPRIKFSLKLKVINDYLSPRGALNCKYHSMPRMHNWLQLDGATGSTVILSLMAGLILVHFTFL
jgi:hypothetical protein